MRRHASIFRHLYFFGLEACACAELSYKQQFDAFEKSAARLRWRFYIALRENGAA